jgi:hypothetical protein
VGDVLRRGRPGRLSRIYGGIHIAADDFAGRRIGSRVGKQAWALAERYFAGTVR